MRNSNPNWIKLGTLRTVASRQLASPSGALLRQAEIHYGIIGISRKWKTLMLDRIASNVRCALIYKQKAIVLSESFLNQDKVAC